MTEIENWKKIGPISGVIYAEMLSEALQNEQIPHHLSKDWFSGAYGISGTAAGGDNAFLFYSPGASGAGKANCIQYV